MKRMLMVATVPSMIGQFNMNNIELLQAMGYDVQVACDFTDRSVWTEERVLYFKKILAEKGISKYQIDFSRSAMKLNRHIRSYKQLFNIIKENQYEFVHCHTPIAGVITRLACQKAKTKCIYTAHGFHFFKGAPIKNWLLYFPIEWICSWMTDVLLTINQEDYNRAKRRMHAKSVRYVPGVGIDVQGFNLAHIDKDVKRCEFGIDKEDFLMLSIGELSQRKNHELVIRAIKALDDQSVKYIICGKGELQDYLEKLIKDLGVEKQVLLLGFRTDISEICQIADMFVFPSFQEGLPVALMEAMASGLPCVVSNIRGNVDLIKDKRYLFNPFSVSECANSISTARKQNLDEVITVNLKRIKSFDVQIVRQKMCSIYKELIND